MPARDFGDLSWEEIVTVRRIRLGWTKDALATKTGIARMTLWRALECKDPKRKIYASDDVRRRVDATLAEGELAQAGAQGEAVA